MPVAAPLEIRDKDRSTLLSWTRSPGMKAGLARRARIVLLAGEGVPNTEIAKRVGVSRPTVNLWRARYATGGVAALTDEPRSGRPREVTRPRSWCGRWSRRRSR
jgi:transposase